MKWEVDEVKWLGRLLSSATPRPQDHVSIWSVKGRYAKTFFRVAEVLWLVAIAFIVYKSVDVSSARIVGWAQQQVWQSIGDFIFAVLSEFGTVAIPITIVSMLLTPAVNTIGEILMSLYQAMVNRLVTPVIEAHKAEGREEGREEGRIEVMGEWRAWNERRLAAAREGRRFDEQPPGD